MSYYVYVIADNGQGRVTQVQKWDGNDVLELDLAVFARDAIISIEPILTKPDTAKE